MIIHWILISLVLQFLVYFLLDRLKLAKWKFLILALAILAHWFIYPQFFIPEPQPGDIRCGLPVLGVMMAFWILGTIGAIASHFIYTLSVVVFKNIIK